MGNQQDQKYTCNLGVWDPDPTVTFKMGCQLYTNPSVIAVPHIPLHITLQKRENFELFRNGRRERSIKASHQERIETRMINKYNSALSW